ncbi:hypothetical protein LCGC14_3054170, partial [marine sediment metagenome]
MKLFQVIILLMAATVQAEEYYVSKEGNDINPGSLSRPWLTIQKATTTLAAGDTVYIRGGRYKERVVPKRSGIAGKPITYTAYPNEIATIDGSGIRLPSDWGGLLDISGKNYIYISGLWITNAGPNDNNPGILVDNSGHVTLAGNTIYNTVSSGIGVWNSFDITIDNNLGEVTAFADTDATFVEGKPAWTVKIGEKDGRKFARLFGKIVLIKENEEEVSGSIGYPLSW